VDRGSKATSPLTMHYRVFKSSAKDSACHTFGRKLRGSPPWLVVWAGLANGTSPWVASTLTWVGAGDEQRHHLLSWILWQWHVQGFSPPSWDECHLRVHIHPQSNGAVERANALIFKAIKKILKGEKKGKWAEVMPRAVWSHNTAACRATNFTLF
jgi:hypothetical protein